MKKTVVSPGSATIINAISTGFGSAFGIDLNIKASVSENNKGKIISKSDIGADTKLMDMCADAILKHYNVDCPLTIETETNVVHYQMLFVKGFLLILQMNSILNH